MDRMNKDVMASSGVRPARADDYATFVRLVPELRVDDPIPEEARFVDEIARTTLIAEDASGAALGYAYFQCMRDVAFVRHVVTAPQARRRGVGSMLMRAVAEQARRNGCATWCLNVKPDNEAAIALYERMGMSRAFESCSIRIDWAAIDAEVAPCVEARRIGSGDDARVESAMNLLAGQLEAARATEERVLMMLEDPAGTVVGAAIFHPHFPGAYPFRVARPELASTLLQAIRPHARAADTFVNVVVEGQPAVAAAVVAMGGNVRLTIVNMNGPLP